jgi:hypothetical protein
MICDYFSTPRDVARSPGEGTHDGYQFKQFNQKKIKVGMREILLDDETDTQNPV